MTVPVNNEYFLVYEHQLKLLPRFSPRCGSRIITENTEEVQNEGSQLSLQLHCVNGCNYKWQSQPTLDGIRSAGILLHTAGIFFSGLYFSKFETFSNATNLKSIIKDTYYIREKHVFPVVWLISCVKTNG